MEAAARKTIFNIEIWHFGLLLLTMIIFSGSSLLEPKALLAGGIFMGVNFLLLSVGVAWILTPLAGKRRIKSGIALLALKILLFLGLLTMIFFNFDIDIISFAVGFSTLLLAIIVESCRRVVRLGT